ncbi:terpenoid synthase [Fomitopsis serialis]|uniref:terpenoid synthase n=1 Tax=Fomitopsis serialis TaxID=139415 RepID=UPI0020086B0C|nr:terpenoid synthase [Neoantrodia serialis]KAH9910892.1 terpenoid synthase [Neoantrodia serialis]
MSSTRESFLLPDIMHFLPFKGSINPHYERAAKASSAWVNSYSFVPEHKRVFFQQGGSELLCAYTHPYAGYEELRTIMDLINLLFAMDEISDDQNGKVAYKTGRILLNTLRDPDSSDGSALVQMTKGFRERLLRFNRPACYQQLIKHTEDYVNAVVLEAELRERKEVLDPDAYIVLRRENSAVRCCFALFGIILGAELPAEILEHPTMMRLHLAAVDMTSLSNDLYSYNREQAMGHAGSNFLTVLMKSKHCDLQTSADHLGAHFKQLMDDFQVDKTRLPSWGPQTDAVVTRFVVAMEIWVVGNCEWSFETPRYFGAQREQVKRTRDVELYPQRHEHDG